MKLLYLADIRFPMERANGIQTIETCHALARAGVEVELVVQKSDGRSDAECLAFFDLEPHENLRLRRVSLPGRIGFLLVSLWRRLARWDFVYTRDLLIADLLLRFPGAPLVYEAHTVASVFAEERAKLYQEERAPSPAKLRRLDARERRVCRKAAAVVSITEALSKELAKRHGPLRRSAVVPDGAHVPKSMPPPAATSRVTYIGQLYPWKGVDVLVEAMPYVGGAELVVVGGLKGEPDIHRLQSLAEKLGLDDRVDFHGFIPPGELEREREQAAVLVVPNLDSATARFFTSPLKLFEAMASGRPVVASDLPSIREILTHEQNALLVPPGDARALAAAILRLLKDRELAELLASRAFEEVKAYSWDRRAEAIRKVLSSVG